MCGSGPFCCWAWPVRFWRGWWGLRSDPARCASGTPAAVSPSLRSVFCCSITVAGERCTGGRWPSCKPEFTANQRCAVAALPDAPRIPLYWRGLVETPRILCRCGLKPDGAVRPHTRSNLPQARPRTRHGSRQPLRGLPTVPKLFPIPFLARFPRGRAREQQIGGSHGYALRLSDGPGLHGRRGGGFAPSRPADMVPIRSSHPAR